MADQPIYKRDDIEGPVIHAFVIGVGHYPHLNGGGKKPMKASSGMGQLTSAPHSAREFAKFLLEEWRDPIGREIASLRLLISEEIPQLFKAGPMRAAALPRPATIDEVDDAANGWLADLNSDADNVAIFFFSGHGVMAGLNEALLLTDVGAKVGNPHDAAIRFHDFHEGMAACRASSQIYFVDACRSFSKTLRDTWKGGRALITEDAAEEGVDYSRIAPKFMATLVGDAAFGVKDSPSIYTQALVESLRGAGSNNTVDQDRWVVETYGLLAGLNHLVREASRRHGLGEPQLVSADSTAGLELHSLTGDPLVPIFVECIPENDEAELAVEASNHAWIYKERAPFLPPGDWVLTAKIVGPPALAGAQSRNVRPPFVKFKIELGPDH